MDLLIDYFNNQLHLTNEEINFLREQLEVLEIPKNEFLLKEGQISKAFFFNLDGFIRLFYNKDGQEKTAYFFAPGTFISAYESYTKQIPSTLNLQAIESSKVVKVGLETAQNLLHYSPKFAELARIAMESELVSYQKMVANLLTLRPEERYLQLLQDHPALFLRVPQQYIASYIGVSPETLSRIKKRKAEKNS